MALTEADIKIIIAAELKKKGFKDAEKAAGALDKQFKNLGKSVAAFFGAREVINFGKAAVQAFSEDEVAANRLAMAMQGLNLAFATPEVERYLESLEKQTAITKNELRPAFQQLANTTRSLAMSQDILNTAIDVAAGSGESLSTVISDLSKSFLGNNAGLSKYGLALSKTELKTKTFAEIQELLNKQFSGQRAAYLDTYAGKISMLEGSYSRMQTTIGSGLVDAFEMLAGDSGIGGATTAMENFGTVSADVIRGVGVAISEVSKRIPFFDKIFSASNIPVIGAYIDMFRALGEPKRPLFFPTAGIGEPAIAARSKAIEEAAIKRQKELEALRQKSIKSQEKANRLKRLSIMLTEKEKNFDLTRIQLAAAMQGKLTQEEANRVKQLMMIEDIKEAIAAEDADKAEKLMDELKRLQDETFKLATQLTSFPKANNPFEDWFGSLDSVVGKFDAIIAATAAAGDAAMKLGDAYAALGGAQNRISEAMIEMDKAQKAIASASTAEELAAAMAAAEAAQGFLDAANTEAESAQSMIDILDPTILDQPVTSTDSTVSNTTININVEGSLDPYGTARAIADTINLEATTSGSFGALGYSTAFGVA